MNERDWWNLWYHEFLHAIFAAYRAERKQVQIIRQKEYERRINR